MEGGTGNRGKGLHKSHAQNKQLGNLKQLQGSTKTVDTFVAVLWIEQEKEEATRGLRLHTSTHVTSTLDIYSEQ